MKEILILLPGSCRVPLIISELEGDVNANPSVLVAIAIAGIFQGLDDRSWSANLPNTRRYMPRRQSGPGDYT